MRWKGGVGDQFVDEALVVTEGFKDGVFFPGEIEVGFDGAGFVFDGEGEVEVEVAEVVEDLRTVCDEGGSVADEVVAAGGGGTVDGAGDGVDVASGFGCQICGDEGAGAAGTFDNEGGAGPVGHDTVALRESLFVGCFICFVMSFFVRFSCFVFVACDCFCRESKPGSLRSPNLSGAQLRSLADQ